MARKKVTSVPALADWGAVDNALRDIRECQHTLAEMAVQRDRQIDSIKADYAQGALPLQNRVKALESEVKAYDTTCYADPQRAFDSFMRQLREFLGLAPRVRRNKRIVSHPQPHKVGKYRAPHLRPDPHPHLPRDRLQEYHSEPEIPPEGSCSRADEAQDDSDTDNTDEGDHLCLTG